MLNPNHFLVELNIFLGNDEEYDDVKNDDGNDFVDQSFTNFVDISYLGCIRYFKVIRDNIEYSIKI